VLRFIYGLSEAIFRRWIETFVIFILKQNRGHLLWNLNKSFGNSSGLSKEAVLHCFSSQLRLKDWTLNMSKKLKDSQQAKLFDEGDGSSSKRNTKGSAHEIASCPFCEIILNQYQSVASRQILFRDDVAAAFLDRKPVFLGHTLVIPIKHYETLLDSPKEVIPVLFLDAQLIARGVKTAMKADGIFLGINSTVSQSVPHLHIHIIPRKFGDGLRGFFWPRRNYDSEEQMKEISQSIMQAIGAETKSD
jgi:histidine triad (HIT) family protein